MQSAARTEGIDILDAIMIDIAGEIRRQIVNAIGRVPVGAKGGVGILNYLVDIGLDGVGRFEFTGHENDQTRFRSLSQGAYGKVVRSRQPMTDCAAFIKQAQIEGAAGGGIEGYTSVRAK